MSRQRPSLRNGVDIQLQSAFQDGNWSVAMRLASQRARTFNDQYFDLDDPNAKFAAVAAVDKFVKDGTVVKDVDGIDLLEWATSELLPEDAFSETLGPLRVRAVKAAPKDKSAATRSFAQERDFMFWNIVITHMLATSSQCSPNQQNLYGMLAKKQIERAAQLAEQALTSESEEAPVRGIKTEEEILLMYDIVETHGTADDVKKLIESPLFSPVAQFRLGRKELFQRTAAIYRKQKDWEALCNICESCLSHKDKNGELSLLACDWLVWKNFIQGAAHLRNSNTEIVERLQSLLLELARSKSLKPIYKRNVLLARVSAAFSLKTNDDDDIEDDQPSSLRLRELINYIQDQKSSAACFDDVKEFLEQLDISGLKHVAYRYIAQLAQSVDDPVERARVLLLSLKTQYFLSTCPIGRMSIAGEKPSSKCLVCSAKFESESCPTCLTRISEEALASHRATSKDVGEDAVTQNEILPELSVVVAFCNIKLAFRSRPGYIHSSPPVSQYLLRALFILEHQAFLTPKHSQISLLLVQLHLLVGSAHRAREAWHGLAVKRTIVDSLAPIFYDRLSTVSPIMLDSSDGWGWELVETLRSHYANSLKLKMPRRLIDAFEAASYGSIIDMPKYIENLRFGCTRAMSLVEEARANRLLGEPCGEFLNDARFNEVSDDLVLRNVLGHGSFPSWDCGSSRPVHERLRLGPGPSNTRSHLSLLGEALQDILSYRPPTVYKAAAAAVTGIDKTFVVEMMARIGNSMSKFVHKASGYCTTSEMFYFEAVNLLAALIPLCVSIDKSVPLPDVFGQITEAVTAAITTQLDELPELDGTVAQTVSGLRSLHEVTMLRDTAMAAKLAAQWILSLNEREKERDRSGSSNLPREVVSRVKDLQAGSEAALKEGKSHITKLKQELGTGSGLVEKLRTWAFEDGGRELNDLVEDGTLKEVVESWRQNLAGWERPSLAWQSILLQSRIKMPETGSSTAAHSKGGVPLQNPQQTGNDAGDSRVPLSAEPGVYKDDGAREVPISAEPGVYRHDGQNSPKEGVAGDQGVRIKNQGQGIGSKV
ncbi:N-acetyltransferase B complex, non-catalytic subunit [Metarhizium album ARSEF 1941]|uniref:N-acetyltransferase B complex, non-catalytic subunit n=1 Tax=Metarhizium album (strain ARSEF 1941) TaxID=1081103 RepID=A0A0B2WR93_METAS|nr:N-acetyltransferase B complex, non-catalytic subunit [Metarhizium album ARSEF 1941]KHN96017.1 N-acetyltransferase B complex, non-catalytic subunit [Metarhizium album ARSEF 1941]